MVEERDRRYLKSWWGRGLEERGVPGGGEVWKRAEFMVEERAGKELKS